MAFPKRNPDFNYKLFQIAENITSDVLKKMKFLCDLPEGVKESINEPLEFLSELQTRGKIYPGEVTYLVSLLEKTNNLELAGPVLELESVPLDDSDFNNLPVVTRNFIGREKVVSGIVTKLRDDAFRMFVIISIPGMGKTEVALKVGRDLLEKKKPVILILKQDSLADACGEIIRRITGRKLSESHDLVSLTKEKLTHLKSSTTIILDNTENIQEKEGKEFDEFAKYIVKFAPKVKLIITTRQDVGFKSLNLHKEILEPLDHQSAVLLLQRSVANCQDYAQELAQFCCGIPLLLVACVDLLNDSFDPKVLITSLKESPSRFLKISLEDVYDKLGGFLRNNWFLKYLVRVSVFPSTFSVEDIKIFFDDHLEMETIKTRMVSCSLVQRMTNKKYSLHPLVREYCRAERKNLEMEKVGKAAQDKFNRHYIEMLKTWSKQFITKDLAMQAISSFKKDKVNIMDALWNCLQESSSADEKEFVVDVVNSTEVLDFLSKVISPPNECSRLYQRCHDVARTSGDNKRLADSLNALGFRHLCDVAHRKVDKDNQSFKMFKQAYDLRMKLPKERQNCEAHALTMCKLGLCYSLQGEHQTGQDFIREGISMKENLGISLYVAAGYCDLGNSYRILGDHKEAIKIWENKTLEVYRTNLGDHPWTATILLFIAGSYKALADENIDSAIDCIREALELRIKLLDVHQDTAHSHVILSDALEGKKDFKSAYEELAAALDIQKEVLGECHDRTKETLAKMERISAMIGNNTT
ncbi:uncharacterized protein [Montipora foliosa]|uniref:uncharacterized protein isoform X2 n=1 Tax=Montipora foliosa TaxID=591990 RepID=UPI0035F1F53A